MEGGGEPTSPLCHRATVIRTRFPDIEARRLERVFRQATDRNLLDRLQIARPALGPEASGRRRRPGDHPPHRPLVVQRPARGLAWRREAPQGQGQGPGHPISRSRRDPPMGYLGPTGQRFDRAYCTHDEPGVHVRKALGIPASRSAVRWFCRGSASGATARRTDSCGASRSSRPKRGRSLRCFGR